MPELPPSRWFPPAESANEYGLVCVGGTLRPDNLLDAYRHGLFPWPLIDGVEEPQWWSPDPRAIFELNGFHVSRRLGETLRGGRFTLTGDKDFSGVIRGCATVGDRHNHTWLTPEMIAAYEQLHRLGHAHSVETWSGGELAGGVYGVATGGLFAAESMFFRQRDASKVALFHLVQHLRRRGYCLMDIQQLTDHTASLGAVEIPRMEYLERLAEALELQVEFGTLEPPDYRTDDK
ncbi:MAG TPA: leucyl/phenylalanyl-tRNA--protein transferase [Pirellulales bacterium]|jgi:leucyl/phenylalanyl-tRNA--protein transferase|nr:leucyl/phenylalanyl-tRNA--protein transferase [Pirellulales bacterium]